MDILSWVLTFVVMGYALALTFKTGAPLYRHHKAKDRVVKVTGEIWGVFGTEKMRYRGTQVQTFYPVYGCEIGGSTRQLNGVVRHVGDTAGAIGKRVVLLYDKETGEIWCEEDLPLMKKQIIVRLVTVVALLLLMIVTSVML